MKPLINNTVDYMAIALFFGGVLGILTLIFIYFGPGVGLLCLFGLMMVIGSFILTKEDSQ